MNSCMGRERSWSRRRRSKDNDTIQLCKDEMDCCMPSSSSSASARQQFQWHRRLSPVKRLPRLIRASSLIGPGSSSSSSSPVKKEAEESPYGGREERKKEEEEEEEVGRRKTDMRDNRCHPTPLAPLPSAKMSAQNGATTPAPVEGMGSSMLISPAWYRDGQGRTGFRHEMAPISARLRMQSSPIKEMNGGTADRRCQNGTDTHSNSRNRSQIPVKTPRPLHYSASASPLPVPPTLSHFSSSPNTVPHAVPKRPPATTVSHLSTASTVSHPSVPSSASLLPPRPVPHRTAVGAPHPLRNNGRTEHRIDERGGGGGRGQQHVKFAETVQINEFASSSAEDGDRSAGSSCSNASAASSSSSSSSSMSLLEEQRGQLEPRRRQSMINGSSRSAIGGMGRARSADAGEADELDRVIQQFLHQCKSISALGPSDADDQQQQRSIYDNVQTGQSPKNDGEEGGGGDDWLHTKTKMVMARRRKEEDEEEDEGRRTGGRSRSARNTKRAGSVQIVPLMDPRRNGH